MQTSMKINIAANIFRHRTTSTRPAAQPSAAPISMKTDGTKTMDMDGTTITALTQVLLQTPTSTRPGKTIIIDRHENTTGLLHKYISLLLEASSLSHSRPYSMMRARGSPPSGTSGMNFVQPSRHSLRTINYPTMPTNVPIWTIIVALMSFNKRKVFSMSALAVVQRAIIGVNRNLSRSPGSVDDVQKG